jgi:hypothetical protein
MGRHRATHARPGGGGGILLPVEGGGGGGGGLKTHTGTTARLETHQPTSLRTSLGLTLIDRCIPKSRLVVEEEEALPEDLLFG